MSRFKDLIKDIAKAEVAIKAIAKATGMDMEKVSNRIAWAKDSTYNKLGNRLVVLNQIMLKPVDSIAGENFRDTSDRVNLASIDALAALETITTSQIEAEASEDTGLDSEITRTTFEMVKESLGHHTFMDEDGSVHNAHEPDGEMTEEALNYLAEMIGCKTSPTFSMDKWNESEKKAKAETEEKVASLEAKIAEMNAA